MPDDEQNRFGRSLGEGYSYVALGFTFAVAILAFGALGWVVDGWLGTRPWFALVGAAIGGVGGVFWMGRGGGGGKGGFWGGAGSLKKKKKQMWQGVYVNKYDDIMCV